VGCPTAPVAPISNRHCVCVFVCVRERGRHRSLSLLCNTLVNLFNEVTSVANFQRRVRITSKPEKARKVTLSEPSLRRKETAKALGAHKRPKREETKLEPSVWTAESLSCQPFVQRPLRMLCNICFLQLVIGTIGCRMVGTICRHYTVPFAPLTKSTRPSSTSTVLSKFHAHPAMVANPSYRESSEPSVASVESALNPLLQGKTTPWRCGYPVTSASRDLQQEGIESYLA